MTPSIIWDAVAGFARAVNAILSFVPALVWAIALLLALSYGGVMHHERDSAVKEKNEAIGARQQIEAQLEQQKKEAAEKLAALTKERDAAQARANESHRQQEIKDANNRKTIADQVARLRALSAAAPGGQLRDPNAGRGCGGAKPEGDAAADGRGSTDDAAAAGGLVSAPLSGLLREQAGGADKWADLYGRARADALMCRAATGAPP
jgi:hypothetical protein